MRTRRSLSTAAIAALLSVAAPAFADQTVIPDYDTAREKFFWPRLYMLGGWTLYCGAPFFARSSGLQVEHVYPASWMGEHLQCGSRAACRASSERFNHMEADLHNLFPSLPWVNMTRSNDSFGVLEGEEWFFEDCDFERGFRARDGAPIVEVREKARGEIARAFFYMHSEYGLPIEEPLGELLKEWNRADPPSWDERRRNRKIQELQGTRNHFIDDPALADDLSF